MSGRGAAIHATVTLFQVTGDPKYYEAILEGLGERRDQTVRIVSRTALIAMGDRVRPDMERLLKEGTALQRENAAEVLAELDRRASPPGRGPKVARRKVPKAVSRKALSRTATAKKAAEKSAKKAAKKARPAPKKAARKTARARQ